MIEEVEPMLRGRAELAVVDVDDRDAWRDAYGQDVPVLLLDEIEVCRHRLDRAALLAALDGATAAGSS